MKEEYTALEMEVVLFDAGIETDVIIVSIEGMKKE